MGWVWEYLEGRCGQGIVNLLTMLGQGRGFRVSYLLVNEPGEEASTVRGGRRQGGFA